MLLPKSVAYAYHVLSLSLQVFVEQKMGVVIYMYLKDSPDSWSNSLGSTFLAAIPFFWGAFLALRRKGKWCGQVEPSPCYSQSEVICAYQVSDL